MTVRVTVTNEKAWGSNKYLRATIRDFEKGETILVPGASQTFYLHDEVILKVKEISKEEMDTFVKT